MTLRFCPRCGTNVEAKSGTNIAVLIVLIIFFAIAGIIYLLVTYKERCPRCHLRVEYLGPPAGMMVVPAMMAPAMFAYPAAAAAGPACDGCGRPLRWIAEYQRWYCDMERQYR